MRVACISEELFIDRMSDDASAVCSNVRMWKCFQGNISSSFSSLFRTALISLTANMDTTSLHGVDFTCSAYLANQCNKTVAECETEENCSHLGPSQYGCYAVWKYIADEVNVLYKGCWTNQNGCDSGKCVATGPSTDAGVGSTEVYFCCCNQPMCNRHFQLAFDSLPITSTETTPSMTSTNFFNNLPFLEMVSRGHYGSVWRATMGTQTVAVKIFQAQHIDSWVQEQEIYGVAGLKSHPNVLSFVGAEVRGSDPRMEYWIITAFHVNGSLHDYLKKKTVTFNELLRIAVSMLRGLSYLHEEILNNDKSYKPTIVHRDFKSRNVLLKDDLVACVADFGLALVCEHGRTPNETHGQVGTRRYMAPEVLEGATEFSAFAFRQIDVYAAALVLWELLSRCGFKNVEPGEYMLPFEAEVGLRPSLQEIQEIAVIKKRRPILKAVWREDPHAAVVCSAIEEMWDNEPEARISAGCAAERLDALVSVAGDHSAEQSKGELTPLIVRQEKDTFCNVQSFDVKLNGAMSLCEIGLSEFDFRDCEPLPEPPEGRNPRNRSIKDVKHTLRLVKDDKYYLSCNVGSSADKQERIVGATSKLIGLHRAFKEKLLDVYERARKSHASSASVAQSSGLDRAYKHTAKCCLFSDHSSSSSSSGEASDSGSTSGSDSSRRRAIYRKQSHPARLHPDLWFNERGEMNDGPVCRCCWKARQRGVAHYIFAGEKPIEACDPLTNNRNRLYYYKLSVSPDINLTKEYSTTKIMYEGREFTFDGYGILCHSEVPTTIPDRLMIRWNIEYKLSLEKEPFPEYFTAEDCCLFWQYFFVDLMELYDVNLLPSGSCDGCPTFHVIPRFVVKNSDNSIELLPMSAVLEHLLRSYEPVFCPNAFASGAQWNDLVANLKGQLVSNPFKRPSSLRLDQIDRTAVVPDCVDGCYPVIVHFGVRPAVMTYNGNPEYQREYRKFLKFCRLIQLKPSTSSEDKNKMAEWKENLKIMKDKVSATRDVTIELSSKGFYKTGIYSDMVQHGLKLIVMFHHIRFHLSLRVLEQRLQYSFNDRALLELALTHPSYRPNYATNADHIRNTLSNCGLPFLFAYMAIAEYVAAFHGDMFAGIQKLMEVMSQMGCKTAKESEAMNNERLEFLGDAVIEFLTTIHLYYMFSDLEEGGLATFRSTLVQNNHLAVLARKIGLDEFMLYVHGPDLCHEEDLKHAMANAFEALLGALFLDGGIAVTDRVYGCTLFPAEEDEDLHWIWFNPPLHPLQAEEPNGDRHLVDGIEILRNLTEFEDQIGIKFTHIRLLARAFTRKSRSRALTVDAFCRGHNQRMEFLGDTVLQLITSEYLYKYFPTHQEGHLSLLRSCLVSNKTQAVICDDIGIPKFVNPPVPILANNSYDLRTKDKADLVESFLGALFVDKGLEYCKLFCQLCFIPRLKHFILNQKWSDPKTRLQQSCIALRDPSGGEPEIPQYKVVSVEGPTNTRVYKVAVYFRNSRLAVGYGQSIKDAEIDAAETALHTKADMLPKILRRETCKAPKAREASDLDVEKRKKVCSCMLHVHINPMYSLPTALLMTSRRSCREVECALIEGTALFVANPRRAVHGFRKVFNMQLIQFQLAIRSLMGLRMG
ncbi:hypothetical protein M514_07574 [Trichuris suis]|uniref:receptor protein serine/threonine kinase n=1 Tax=Trichuris suis TaxID=68888 RepID=A0A085NCL3_9BILA|nr:hypothetical protein M514_07574 [Trichuris suis]